MLQIVDSQMTDRDGVITIQGDNQDEVMSRDARNAVLQFAAKNGLPRPGLSGGESAYPVDTEGKTPDALVLGQLPVAAYRCDYKVTGGL